MSTRNEDPNLITWLRDLQTRIKRIEMGAGTKQNDIRLGNWVMRVNDDGCIELTWLLNGEVKTICECDCDGGGGGTIIHETVEFLYTGSVVEWVVPATVTSLDVFAYGGNGGGPGGVTGVAPGCGSQLTGSLTVIPGETLFLQVGGSGGTATKVGGGFDGTGVAGWPDGGTGGTNGGTLKGAGGGGSTRIWRGSVGGTLLAIVAGGGGIGVVDAGGVTMIRRGDGGIPAPGQAGNTPVAGATTSGGGGTTSGGGAAGPSGVAVTAGASLQGGHGGNGTAVSGNFKWSGGGGGGGIFGGGGGGIGLGTDSGDPMGGQGGGGASYIAPTGWSGVTWPLIPADDAGDLTYFAPKIIIEYDLIVI